MKSRHPARRIVGATLALTVVGVTAFAVQQALAASVSGPPASAPHDSEIGGASTLAPSEADGVVREGAEPSVFDTRHPAVVNLDPELLAALQRAATDAGDDYRFVVNGGWRSPVLQQRLLDDAIAEYGSEQEARRWVASPETSVHVSGGAVDMGTLPTLDFLAQHCDEYGLCQIYANERWHFELRPDAVEHGCPEMYADPTEDPRMQD